MFETIILLLRNMVGALRKRSTLLRAAGIMILILLLSSFLFHLYEGYPLSDSFYWAVTTSTTVGYGDISPTTFEGKILAMGTMILGISILGIFFASLASTLMELSLGKVMGFASASGLRNHVVVCGWSKKLEVAVRELLSEKMNVVVVAGLESSPVENKRLIFIKGDPTRDEDLQKAGIRNASHALVAPDDDAKALLSTITVRNLAKDIRIVSIVADGGMVQTLRRVGADEVLGIDDFSGLLLARSVFVPSASDFFSELMSVRGMDLYQVDLPAKMIGKSFADVLENLKRSKDSIAVGIVRRKETIINPEGGMVLEEGDKLLVIAREKVTTF